MMATSALGAGLAASGDEAPPLPDPDPRLLALWAEMGEPRDREAELDWRVAHWRILNGDAVAFDADELRRLEARIMDHAATHVNTAAHARADQGGLERAAELADVEIPTLVIEAPEDPINPPPHAAHLAGLIPGARLVTIPGMGHALSAPILASLGRAILTHTTTTVDDAG
jgi:pimeloyl-ACP methyl ester carboxylesterase